MHCMFLSTVFRVRQGDVLWPTRFGLYKNSLVQELKQGSECIQTEFLINQCMWYADDIALISSSEQVFCRIYLIFFIIGIRSGRWN